MSQFFLIKLRNTLSENLLVTVVPTKKKFGAQLFSVREEVFKAMQNWIKRSGTRKNIASTFVNPVSPNKKHERWKKFYGMSYTQGELLSTFLRI